MLNEKEWLSINEILLELYKHEDLIVFSKNIMRSLRKLISYTKGCFILLDEEQNTVKEKVCFVGFDNKAQKNYIEKYYDKDYIKTLYDFVSETNAYRDTDILNKNARESTDFYLNFLKPEQSIFGCGIMIVRNDRIICEINLFRDEESGDFDERDMFILNIFKNHLENIVCRLIDYDKNSSPFGNGIKKAVSKYELTTREAQVLELICSGESNQNIADILSISVSTVKKHIYNLFDKISVQSRGQLISVIIELK